MRNHKHHWRGSRHWVWLQLLNSYLIWILLINSIEYFQQTFSDVWTDTAKFQTKKRFIRKVQKKTQKAHARGHTFPSFQNHKRSIVHHWHRQQQYFQDAAWRISKFASQSKVIHHILNHARRKLVTMMHLETTFAIKQKVEKATAKWKFPTCVLNSPRKSKRARA